jgi:hypothetical protein
MQLAQSSSSKHLVSHAASPLLTRYRTLESHFFSHLQLQQGLCGETRGPTDKMENLRLEFGVKTEVPFRGRSPCLPLKTNTSSLGVPPRLQRAVKEPEYWLELTQCNQTLGIDSCMIGGGSLQIEHMTLLSKAVERSRTIRDD